jgi:hypothetical protein
MLLLGFLWGWLAHWWFTQEHETEPEPLVLREAIDIAERKD